MVGAELARPGRRARGAGAARGRLRAGAIETARLLLASDVGNEHDQVGRYLQGHVYAGAVGVFDEPVQDSVGPGPLISTTDFRHHNEGILGGGILANEFVPIPIEAYTKLSRRRRRAGLGTGRRRRVARGLHAHPVDRRAGPGGPAGELARHARARGDRRQRHARRAPARRRPRAQRRAHRRSSSGSARRNGWRPAAPARPRRCCGRRPRAPARGQHQAGTCRMGSDPRTSVTDPWGRVWGHDGVTVADGSLHVTNGGVNPVLTILALAWRTSEHLAAELVAVSEVNWAGNHRYRAERIHRPSTLEEVQEIVAAAARVRALGSRHSFNDIADADRAGVARPALPADVVVDRAAGTVSFGAGVTLRRAGRRARRRGAGAAQPRLAPAHLGRRRGRDRHPRLGGRATATSRRRSPRWSWSRRAARSSPPRAATRTSTASWSASARSASSPASRSTSSPPTRCASACSRASRGTRCSSTSTRSPRRGYSVSVFTRWARRGRPGVGQEPGDGRAGAGARATSSARAPATVERHPILGLDPVNCTPQLGRPGPWSDRLPHFRMGFTPSSGEELQSEYLVPREHAVAALAGGARRSATASARCSRCARSARSPPTGCG